VYFTIIFVAV